MAFIAIPSFEKGVITKDVLKYKISYGPGKNGGEDGADIGALVEKCGIQDRYTSGRGSVMCSVMNHGGIPGKARNNNVF